MRLFVYIGFIFLTGLFSCAALSGQNHPYSLCRTHTHSELQLLAAGSGIEKHFAEIYSKAEKTLDVKLMQSDSLYASFIVTFSTAFTERYLRACHSYRMGKGVETVWRSYFSDSLKNPHTYRVLGINAHINGDMAEVLASQFTYSELKKFRRNFMSWNSVFDSFTRVVFQEARVQYPKLQKLHRRSLGLDEKMAIHLVHRWRRKAYRTALRHYGETHKIIKITAKRCLRIDKQIERMSKKYLQSQ